MPQSYYLGGKVRASDFNLFANDINDIVGIGTADSGYGQGHLVVTNAVVGGSVTASLWDELLTSMLYAARHQGTTITTPSSTSDASWPVASRLIEILPTLTDDIATIVSNKLNSDVARMTVTPNQISDLATFYDPNGSPSTPTWTNINQVYYEAKVSFTDANARRHFFNSGGQLVLDMSTSTGGTNAPSIGWNVFFEQLGIVRVSAAGTTNDGDGDGDPAFSAVGNKGFYDINGAIPANYTETYSISSDTGGSTIGTHPSLGTQIDMGTYGGGIYSTRRFKLAMKGAEVAGKFIIHLKVTLQEDPQDSQAAPIDIFVNSTFGVAQPLTTPIDSENSGNQYFQPDSPTQTPFVQFIERHAPTVAQTVVWTATETPESL
jgi:hypothetical protein